MAVSMADISKACGVSRQTVGYILNGRGDMFKPETRKTVWATAEELGYRKNATARAMRLGRHQCVGLLLGKITQSYLPEELLQELNLAAERRNYHISLTELATYNMSSLETAPKHLKEVLVDGYLLDWTPKVPEKILELVAQTRLPYVCLNAKLASGCVFPDDLQGGRMVTEHLLKLGHQKISFLSLKHSNGQHYSDQERLAGYKTAMSAAGLSPQVLIGPTGLTPRERINVAYEFLTSSDRPDAVVAYSNPTAIALHIAGMHAGIGIPEDLSVATVDNRPYTLTGLTFDTLNLPWHDVAEKGFEQVLRRSENPEIKPTAERVPYINLEKGDSCRPSRKS